VLPEGELLPRYPEPEIRTADLTRLALDLACWGTPDGSALDWWDAPPPGPLAAGRGVLHALGALDGDRVTERGRRMARLGLHPRLARALLDGAAAIGPRAAAEVVALLDDDTLAAGTEVDVELARLRGGAPGSGRWRAEVTRLSRSLGSDDRRRDAPVPTGPDAAGDRPTARIDPVRAGRPAREARRSSSRWPSPSAWPGAGRPARRCT
jgi:ATP-dependent helicase HrpB